MIKPAVILFLIFLNFLSFGQQNEKELKVNKILNLFKKYQIDRKFEKISSLDDTSLREIEKALYEAEEVGHDLFNDSLVSDHYRWEGEVKKDKNKRYEKVQYGSVYVLMLKEIEKRYGYFDETLVRVHAFIKAKIISISSKSDNHGGRIILKVQPEETLKCRVPYMLQPEFEVWYLNWEGVAPEDDFKEGKTYMIPIWYRPDNIPETKYSVATFVDYNGSRFLVENGIMHDKYNIFKLGESVNWKVFADTVKNKIGTILNPETKK